MKDFSIEGFSKHLTALASGMPLLETTMLERIGVTVREAAKDKIGEYQESAGPFRAWDSLTDETIAGRVREGYSANEPLLRSGSLRGSIDYRVTPPEVQIGSDDPVAEYQEFGTANTDGSEHIPPRSFLGGAAFEKAPALVVESGVQMEAYLASGKVE